MLCWFLIIFHLQSQSMHMSHCYFVWLLHSVYLWTMSWACFLTCNTICSCLSRAPALSVCFVIVQEASCYFPTVFVGNVRNNSEIDDFIHFYSILLSLWSVPSPHVVNPAVNTDGHEHVEVDPQRKPVLCLLVAEPVHQRGFVYFRFEAVAYISWH